MDYWRIAWQKRYLPYKLRQLSCHNYLAQLTSYTQRASFNSVVMDSDHDKDFDTRLMRQIIGVVDKSELRAEWSEEQLNGTVFSQPSLVSPPLRAFQNETQVPGLTFNSLIECPPDLESIPWVSSSRHEVSEELGEGWGEARAPNQKAHHARRRRLRITWDKYRSYLKHKMHDI